MVSTDDELHGVAEKEEDHDEDEGERRPRISLLSHAQGLSERKEKENLSLLSVRSFMAANFGSNFFCVRDGRGVRRLGRCTVPLRDLNFLLS